MAKCRKHKCKIADGVQRSAAAQSLPETLSEPFEIPNQIGKSKIGQVWLRTYVHFRIIKESIQRFNFFIHTNVSMRTYCIEKSSSGQEYFIFRGDEHRIYVRETDGSWNVIDDASFLRSQCRESKDHSELWSHLACLPLQFKRYPCASGDSPSKEDFSETLPLVDSIRSVGIPTLRALFSIKQMYPSFFEGDRFSQCQECGTPFLPSAHCPYGHDRPMSPEIVRLARCLLIQFELGVAFAHMPKKRQFEWTPARHLMWQKQGSYGCRSVNRSVCRDHS